MSYTKHPLVANRARQSPLYWVKVKTYPNIQTALVMASMIRTGKIPAYGDGFDAKKRNGTEVWVKVR